MQARRMLHVVVVLVTVTLVALISSKSWARGGGVDSSSWGGPTGALGCGSCHTPSGATPAATLTGPTAVAPGSTNQYTLNMTTDGTRTLGAMNVSSLSSILANSGVLMLASGGNSANTRTIAGANGRPEITHSSAKTAVGGHVLWDFRLTASSTCGSSTTIFAWANNSNGSGTSGDNWIRATLTVTVQCSGGGNGTSCTAPSQCTSGNCVDGVCCNTPCGGGVTSDCQACNVAGAIGTCVPLPAATVCRPSAGSCDPPEICNGTAATCPTNAFVPATTVCRAAAGTCDAAETCSGISPTCPTDAKLPATTLCRASVGICDVAESCDGSTNSCPTDAFQPATLECRSGSCMGSVATLAANCTGTAATCPSEQTENCSPNTCSAGVCSGGFANGTSCTGASQCTSGNCVDGLCCNTACGGGVTSDCQACDLSASLGTCSPLPSTSVCRTATDVCDVAETCDGGSSACPTDAFASPATSCRAASCSAGVSTAATNCSGNAATCPPATVQNCAPFLCAGTACATTCSTEADCASGATCSGGVCKITIGNGQACTAPSDCTSGFCTDGVCCDVACAGQCEACDVQGSVGTCAPVVGTPHGSRTACTTDGSACAGTCDGSKTNGCTYPGSTTQCREASCSQAVATLASNCTGTGLCPALQTQNCTPYICGGTQCNGDCSVDDDCSSGAFCNAGVCTTKRSSGVQCTTNNSCSSAFCVDGICCGTACTGQCEACDVAGSLGTCTTLTNGSPHMSHTACAGTGACQGSCDGSSATACAYPNTTTVCEAGSCTDGVQTDQATCDGQGTCMAATTTSCGNYACDMEECKTACATSGDCANAAVCSSAECVVPSDGGAAGDGGSAGMDGSGTGGAAATGGVIAVGGLAGAAGSTDDGSDASSRDEGNCQCVLGHHSSDIPRMWFLLATVLILAGRRYRSARVSEVAQRSLRP